MRCNVCGSDNPLAHVCYTPTERHPLTPGRLAEWGRMVQSAVRAKQRTLTIAVADLADILDCLVLVKSESQDHLVEQWKNRALQAERMLDDIKRTLR